MAGRLDITGQVFGRLTAVRPTDIGKSGRVVWEFRCACGGVKYALVGSVTSGHTQSCGCLLAHYRSTALKRRAEAFMRLGVKRRIAKRRGKSAVLAMLERVGL